MRINVNSSIDNSWTVVGTILAIAAARRYIDSAPP